MVVDAVPVGSLHDHPAGDPTEVFVEPVQPVKLVAEPGDEPQVGLDEVIELLRERTIGRGDLGALRGPGDLGDDSIEVFGSPFGIAPTISLAGYAVELDGHDGALVDERAGDQPEHHNDGQKGQGVHGCTSDARRFGYTTPNSTFCQCPPFGN